MGADIVSILSLSGEKVVEINGVVLFICTILKICINYLVYRTLNPVYYDPERSDTTAGFKDINEITKIF